MPIRYEEILAELSRQPKTWLITGVAGFIGSNLLETLLKLNQRVVGLDNFSTGFQHNLDQVKDIVTSKQWSNFSFICGDIREISDCYDACEGVDYVLHQAALGSVPRSLADPLTTNSVNVSGFFNIIMAARDAQVKSFTYAASSSVYGDYPDLPKIEHKIGNPLSPYALTKYINEAYASVFSRCYDFNTIGLRYFNVFGPRQNPTGAYAAVIPKWISQILNNDQIHINGDGKSSRDFTYIDNVVQANLLAAMSGNEALNQVYNIAGGEQITLNQLLNLLNESLSRFGVVGTLKPVFSEFRKGDVLHSLADINKAVEFLGYAPLLKVTDGIPLAVQWYVEYNCIFD